MGITTLSESTPDYKRGRVGEATTQLAKLPYATQVSPVITTNYCRMTYMTDLQRHCTSTEADHQGAESSNRFATHKISSDMISANPPVPRLHLLPGLVDLRPFEAAQFAGPLRQDTKSGHIELGPTGTHSGFVEIRLSCTP
ncbi:hypothetical protein SMACR_12710 [Sordaria macrospora]|uniref:WGS project CABT00000000 data, contig 2.1 n=2 Tax=Sordaria macrospora TaxID=5147 RepID=F7VKP5_SORMK|nr:uncharacterized protein SMAC_12710 [Sordaria macrospora k-hell]KAA8636861.1 hypothetical protein SMACR_12710 [Sordaria macrospora]WPJ59034.1 hypothetical protein SMAC4_12710 [Sordaria macrospora]CCC06072.1 unnamed protein product [Sordaria macrospora k-hell]